MQQFVSLKKTFHLFSIYRTYYFKAVYRQTASKLSTVLCLQRSQSESIRSIYKHELCAVYL